MAKVLMIQGTMSNAGKSLVTAGLLRVFAQDGYKAAPFKSQNMALNSYVTSEGLEMGRAQVMQAEAAKIEPKVCMNPILLKPTSDKGSQVIVNGKPIGNMPAREYFEYKKQLIPCIKDAFRKLAEEVDIIVIEGAGSPAEINLKDNDIVNMGMAKMVDAPVLLVGDIDRGGVFAQLIGTQMLLDDDEKDRLKGLIINKFRGDKSILDPGIKMLEEKSGKPVVGVLPYADIKVDDEDSLSERLDNKGFCGKDVSVINIAVVKLPHISNFTDFYVFDEIDGVSVNYITSVKELGSADMVIIPGTKNTIADLIWLRESGFEAAIKKFSERKIVFGICGGLQMLGNKVCDPQGVEHKGDIAGMGLLDINTVLTEEKTMERASHRISKVAGPFDFIKGKVVSGYEIHMGKSGDFEDIIINNGNVYGSYLHGFFDEEDIAISIVKKLAEMSGVDYKNEQLMDHKAYKEMQYDRLADMIRENMDMNAVYEMLNEALL